jgi:antitoxin ParD1/3/4
VLQAYLAVHMDSRSIAEMDHVSIRSDVQRYVDQTIADGSYDSADDYISDLILQDARRKAQEKLEALLLEGLDSPSSPMTDEDWARLHRIASTGA